MTIRSLPLLVPLLVGCKDVDDLKDKVSGYTNPTVVEGLVLGVAEPDFEFDLSSTDFGKGATGVIFLADASSADEIESAPISGAGVTIDSDTGGSSKLKDEGSGRYAVSGADGFSYTVGDAMDLGIDLGDDACGATVVAPAAASATISETHAAGDDLAIDLSGESFDSVLVVVFDTASGSVTYSNQPENIKEIYDFTHSGSGGLSLTVPGSALADQTIYAVGVAGLKNAGEDDWDNANTLLSSYMAGKMKFYPVSTM